MACVVGAVGFIVKDCIVAELFGVICLVAVGG